MTKKTIKPEDVELFRQTVGKVQSVKSNKLELSKEKKPKPFPKPRDIDATERFVETEHELDSLAQEDTFSYLGPGMQKNIIKKLRKGHFGLDAELDLHGLTSNEAKHQLLNFLHSSVAMGYRCVHIIHGKGYRSPGQVPVLKNNINLWLRQHQDVQAFCSAPAREGGSGAALVLLYLR